uniref:Ig-like domain-containing protein n=1 Tax=Trichuris muris TaxID=70415 RepID=A0A5S6R4P1_TRIMR
MSHNRYLLARCTTSQRLSNRNRIMSESAFEDCLFVISGTDVTSDDSVCNDSPRITTGYYLSHAGYAVPSYSPLLHHRPVNIEYVPVHRSTVCQNCCCSPAQFGGQVPQAYAHPVTPCAAIVGGLCTYATSSSVDQSHPQHPPPPIVYPPMLPPVFATPYSPGCCPHHGPCTNSVQPIPPFAGCSMDPSNVSKQKVLSRVESPMVSSSDTSSSVPFSETSSKVGKVTEDELATKEVASMNYDCVIPPEESLPLAFDSLRDGNQPITTKRYVTGAKLEREHGRTPLFGDTPSWWNQDGVAEPQSKLADTVAAQEIAEAISSSPDEVASPEEHPQSKQEPSVDNAARPEAPASSYKASVRMDIPFATASSKATAAFTIQFNDDQSTNMVAIEKETSRSYQPLFVPRAKSSTTKTKARKSKPVEEVSAKVPVNENVDEDDAISECGTYTVDEEHSYTKNKQPFDVELDDKNTLLKELIRISNGDPSVGERQRSTGTLRRATASKSGPSSPVTRRTNSASQIVHASRGPTSSQTTQNFRRSDGGRFSMRSKVTMSPGRSVASSSRNCATKGQEVRPETLAWLRRKEYNPLKSAGGTSAKGSTSSDTKVLNNRSKSFHASSRRSSASTKRQGDTGAKESGASLCAKSSSSSPSSLRGQVFVQLASLKKIQMLSVDLMTSASSLKEKIRDNAGNLVDVEEDGNEGTTATIDCPCPLSDVIKKLTVVDKTLKATQRLLTEFLSQPNYPIGGNESTV